MAKSKTPVGLWPAWESPNRVKPWGGRPELREAEYNKAGHGFTITPAALFCPIATGFAALYLSGREPAAASGSYSQFFPDAGPDFFRRRRIFILESCGRISTGVHSRTTRAFRE